MNLMIGYGFFRNRLQASLQPSFQFDRSGNAGKDDLQSYVKINLRYSARGYIFQLSISNNTLRYAVPRPGDGFSENYLQTSVTKEF
jgi:hypothetical protein